jgi:hypothetical protein
LVLHLDLLSVRVDEVAISRYTGDIFSVCAWDPKFEGLIVFMARNLLFARTKRELAATVGGSSPAPPLAPTSASDDETLLDGHMVSSMIKGKSLLG